jgi:hypothetical protein
MQMIRKEITLVIKSERMKKEEMVSFKRGTFFPCCRSIKKMYPFQLCKIIEKMTLENSVTKPKSGALQFAEKNTQR